MLEAQIYIYRNLQRNTYSLRYKGRVIDHSDSVWVMRPRFQVSLSGVRRVRRENKKCVHAYVVGMNDDVRWPQPLTGELLEGTGWQKVIYNPYKHTRFILASTGKAIWCADVAYLTPKGVYVLTPYTD